MSNLGSQLRLARETKGLSLEQVFKATRIKTAYIAALESNHLDALPGLVQARGFVRSYANYLGLNGEELASTLDLLSRTETPMPSAPAVQPIKPIETDSAAARSMPTPSASGTLRADQSSTTQSTSRLRAPSSPSYSTVKSQPATVGGLPTPLLIIGAVVLFVVGLVLIASALSASSQAPLDTSSTSNDSKLVISSITLPTQLAADEPLSLTLVASEHVWLRVTLDGQTAFEGMLEPDSSQAWAADDQMIVETGNAAAVTITYNGKTSTLGQRGQVVARAWSHSDVTDVPVAAPNAASELPSQPTSVATTTIKP